MLSYGARGKLGFFGFSVNATIGIGFWVRLFRL